MALVTSPRGLSRTFARRPAARPRACEDRRPGPNRPRCCCSSWRSISRASIWSSVGTPFSRNVLSSSAARLVLLGLAALRHLGTPFRRLALTMKSRAFSARSFRSAWGKSRTSRSSSFLASAFQPMSIKKPDHPLALVDVLLLDSTEQADDHRARDLAGLDHAHPETVDSAIT